MSHDDSEAKLEQTDRQTDGQDHALSQADALTKNRKKCGISYPEIIEMVDKSFYVR